MWLPNEKSRDVRSARKYQQPFSSPSDQISRASFYHSLALRFPTQKIKYSLKNKAYSIKNVDGSKTITINGEIFQTPNFYRSEIDILETENHSVPVVRIYPLSVK
jgi:hypothetical protein